MSYLRSSILLFACLFLLHRPASSQFSQTRFENLTPEDGLSSARVYDILQDKKGFMWLATMDGLDRFDGYRFKTYRHSGDDATSLSDNIVSALCEDGSGTLWIGTWDGGLNRFDKVHETFKRYDYDSSNKISTTSFPVKALYSDRKGNIWICTLGGGLTKFACPDTNSNPSPFTTYKHEKSNPNCLSSNKVYSIVEDDSGTFFIATDNGLNVLRDGKFTCFKHDPLESNSLCSDLVVSMQLDGSDGLWLATSDGLSYLNRTTWTFTNYQHVERRKNTLSYNFVTSVARNDDRYLWVGTQSGLNKFDRLTGEWSQYSHRPADPNSLVNDYIFKIKSDRSGNVWIATNHGVSRVGKRITQFSSYRHDPDEFADQSVWAIHEDGMGDLWVGTAQGVKRFGRGTAGVVYYKNDPTNPQSLSPGYVQTIIEDREGSIWIGTLGGGLNKFLAKTGNFERHTWMESGVGGKIMSMCCDSVGFFWIGTAGEGLVRFDPRTGVSQRYLHDEEDPRSLSSNTIPTILVDRELNLWIGTEGGGLNMLSAKGLMSYPEDFERYLHNSADSGSLSNNRVYALCEDSKGRIWIATGSGVDMYDKSTHRFAHALGGKRPFSGIILGIVEDSDGQLWLPTVQNGVYRFNPETEQLTNYDVHDGLQSNRFYRAFCKRRDGAIFIGGESGFNFFRPESITTSDIFTDATLTEFRVFDKTAELDTAISEIGEIILSYRQNYFSFEFSSLDFTFPRKNRYRYILEGFDKDWTNAGTRTYASYTNVNPGDYVFRVKGTNNVGLWNEQAAAVRVIVTPPYWETWWFRSLMGAFLCTLLYQLYRYRIAKLLEMEHMRMRIASDLHDDLGSNLGSIALTSDTMRTRGTFGELEREQLLEISAKARKTAESLRDVVWVINPDHDRLDTLALKLRDEATSLLNSIDCSFHCSPMGQKPLPNIEFGRNILLIFKEQLHNIAKHSHATKVSIFVELQGQTFLLRISDNGHGFDPTAVHAGHGLQSMKQRSKKLGGFLDIKSSPKGTIVELSIKIP